MVRRIALIFLIVVTIALTSCGGATPKLLVIEDNLSAAQVQVSMVFGKDFTIDLDYMTTFTRAVLCNELWLEDSTMHWDQQTELGVFVPYQIWACYPQFNKDSPTTVICFSQSGTSWEDAGDMVVISVLQVDTDRALATFGGTNGTEQNGW